MMKEIFAMLHILSIKFLSFILYHKVMKFFSSFPKVLLLGLLFVGVTFAATGDLRSWMDNLSSDIPF